jgi:hypothetical protein
MRWGMGVPGSAVPALLLAATVTWAGEPTPPTVTGVGGSPVSPSVTSMWAAIDEPAASGEKPYTFIVYFRGAKDWQAGSWKTNVRADDEPAVIEFASDAVTLHAEYSRRGGVLRLFRAEVPVVRTNVVVVDDVDRVGSEKVVELAKVDLHVPADANPALWLLERSPVVRKALGLER